MVKYPLSRKYDLEHANYRMLFTVGHCQVKICNLTQWPLLQVIRGHLRSNSFLLLPFDRIEIKYCGWSKCVSLAWTYRPICNMPYWLATWPPVALTWGQIVTLTFYGQMTHISTRLDERTTVAVELCHYVVLLLQKCLRKPLLPKTATSLYFHLWWPL